MGDRWGPNGDTTVHLNRKQLSEVSKRGWRGGWRQTAPTKSQKTSSRNVSPFSQGGIGKRYREEAWISGTRRISSRQPPLSANPFSKTSEASLSQGRSRFVQGMGPVCLIDGQRRGKGYHERLRDWGPSSHTPFLFLEGGSCLSRTSSQMLLFTAVFFQGKTKGQQLKGKNRFHNFFTIFSLFFTLFQKFSPRTFSFKTKGF